MINLLIKSKMLFNKYLKSSIQCMRYSTTNKIKQINFKTCGQLYEELRQKNPKLYRKSPINGFNLNIEYVDTFDDSINGNIANHKTIVAIHGCPGYHYHFKEMINYFSPKNSTIRLIVPNMPDFTHSRQTMAFWHSNRERAQFIRDFLKAIDVNEIDCLVSYSGGLHPISLLWTHPQDLVIKSLCLLCPQPLWHSSFFSALGKSLSMFSTSEVGIRLMDAIKPHIIARSLRYLRTYATVDEMLLTAMMVSNGLDQNQLHQRLHYIRDNQIKTLIVFGERDKHVPRCDFDNLITDLGADLRDFIIYSEECEIIKMNERKNNIKVLLFKGGGHFAFAKYSKEVNENILDFCLKS